MGSVERQERGYRSAPHPRPQRAEYVSLSLRIFASPNILRLDKHGRENRLCGCVAIGGYQVVIHSLDKL